MFRTNTTEADRSPFKNKNVVAWTMMFSAITLHVFDEAVTGFLPFYNQLVLNLKESIGFFPLPKLPFEFWLGGLIFLIIVGFTLIPVVHRGGRVICFLTAALGIVMTLNASMHMIGSMYMGKLLPGFWSSPILLITAVYVIIRGLTDPSWVPRH